MKRLSLRARTSPLMLALLSLGIAPLQSMRAVRASISEPSKGPQLLVADWLINHDAEQRKCAQKA